jgi:hypothetical protein
MRHDEGIFAMNAVYYHSNTGHSRVVAAYLAQKLGWPLLDLTRQPAAKAEMAVLVFPVHCQNLPRPVLAFLETVQTDWLIPIATYGGICHGNVLQQLQKRFAVRIPAAAYVPVQHSYLQEPVTVALETLDGLLCKLRAPAEIRLPRAYQNPMSNIFPAHRSQLGVKLQRTDRCTRCGMCSRSCLHGAMDNGKPNSRCIRCLRCVAAWRCW